MKKRARVPMTAAQLLEGAQLVVQSVPYQVELVSNIHMGETELDGRVAYSAAVIEIDPNRPSMTLILTLWHELFHIFLHHAGSTAEHDEALCEALSVALVDFLIRNRPFVREWLGLYD